jgi:hypothetical protein
MNQPKVNLAKYEDRQKTIEEIVMLGAADGVFFSHQFFPKTVRQSSPDIHYTVWDYMDDPANEHVGLELFRGCAKTTITRVNVAKRISYAVSRTIMIVGPEQKHARRSVRWLMMQMETNTFWTQTFGLKKGNKWSEEEIEIINESADCRIYVIAFGITASTRGLNLDDYRPDFIVLDDCCDEENTGTPEQRQKIRGLLFGNITQSLAPRSEAPHSKIVMLQTGLHKEDLINTAHNDPDWKTVKLGCFDEEGRSTWEERFPTEELLKKKRSFIEQNNLPYWLREMECKIVSFETAAFNINLLKQYEHLPPREVMNVFGGIDPARETKLNTKAHKAAIVFIGVSKGVSYLLEYWAAKDANPEMLWQEFLRMAIVWRPLVTGVETTAYQKTLEWYFNQRMMQTNSPFTLKPYDDRRKKPDRIRQAYTQRIAMGTFQTSKGQHEFNAALAEYTDEVDIDILDAGAIALDIATPWIQAGLFGEDELVALPSGNEPNRKQEYIAPCP